MHIEGARTVDDIGRISAGSGIWYAQGDVRNTCLKHETDLNSNNLGEALAVLWAISEEPPQNELTIKTTSSYVIDTVLKHIHKWEPEGFIGVANKEVLQAIIARLRNRGGPTNFMQLTDDTLGLGYAMAKAWQKQAQRKSSATS